MNLGRLEQIKKYIEDNILTYEAKDFISVLKRIDAVATKFVLDGNISVPQISNQQVVANLLHKTEEMFNIVQKSPELK